MTENHETIDALSHENRRFPPSADFSSSAHVSDGGLHDEAATDLEAFWARQASELISWQQPWSKVLEWDLPYAKWFVDGKLNVAENCLDRHVKAGFGDKVAIHWEGEPGDTRTITYAELLAEVEQFSNALKDLGVAKGDRVNIYLPMIPEAAVAMLACARIGAPHSVVFGGFSSQSLIDRINDAEAKVLITADGGYRRGEVFPLKPAADEAVAQPFLQRLHAPALPQEPMPSPRAEIGDDKVGQLAQPLHLLPQFRLGARIENVQLEPPPSFQYGARSQFVDDGQRRNFPHRGVRPGTVEMQLELPIDRAQLIFGQLEIGEPLDEVGREHSLLAVKAVARQPDQLLLGEADGARVVELFAQLGLVNHVGQPHRAAAVDQ